VRRLKVVKTADIRLSVGRAEQLQHDCTNCGQSCPTTGPTKNLKLAKILPARDPQGAGPVWEDPMHRPRGPSGVYLESERVAWA